MNRTATSDKRPGWHWSDYWRSGRSSVMTLDTAQGGAAFDPGPVWREFFLSFEDGARLLDLATGGGQVARIAAQAATEHGRSLEMVGVDYADLGPSGGAVAPGVALMGGVALEKLPFPAGHFDGASSQFGIEYSDTRLALAELARVLRRGARARMLIHHADSVVSQWTMEQTAAYDAVLGEGAAVRQARRAFTAHLKRLPPEATRAAEEGFRAAVARAASRLQPSAAFDQTRYFVGYLDDLARRIGAYEPASALRRLDEFEAGNAAWRQRHRSQIKAALGPESLETFLQRAARVGLAELDRAEQTDARGAMVGWRIDLQRN